MSNLNLHGFEFCHCRCHYDDNVIHNKGRECCSKCKYCGKNIRTGYMDIHLKKSCKEKELYDLKNRKVVKNAK